MQRSRFGLEGRLSLALLFTKKMAGWEDSFTFMTVPRAYAALKVALALASFLQPLTFSLHPLTFFLSTTSVPIAIFISILFPFSSLVRRLRFDALPPG